jgi:hypothetical protein
MQLAYVESGEERRRTRVAWRFLPTTSLWEREQITIQERDYKRC